MSHSDRGAPLVTFLLVTYNQATMVEPAVLGAFAQTYSPLEIILSDDSSTDETFAVLQRLATEYRGPHTVRAVRTPRNLGLSAHIHHAVNNTRGDLIVIAAGDDISLPHRVEALADRWFELGRETAVIYSGYSAIDTHGRPISDWTENVYEGPFSQNILATGTRSPYGATSAFTPDLITKWQPVSSSVRYEDRVYGFRAFLIGGQISFVDQRLVLYRVEGGISRFTQTDRIADARQRLRDALCAQPANARLLRQCRATVNDHRLRIVMSDGKHLVCKSLYFAVRGARLAPLTRHFVNCVIANLRLWRRGLRGRPGPTSIAHGDGSGRASDRAA
jgi:glycosyltransferase involved in cell wall biosynthesis